MDGVLLLNKPKGMTSHDCVAKVRRLLGVKKAGHTGTLDPNVSGVLPICLGKATRIAEFLTGTTKTYEGKVTLGAATTTEDADGDIIAARPVDRSIARAEIEAVFDSLTGEIEQTPPMYSAVKVGGKKLYEYARAGIEVERPTRRVTIYELELLDECEQFFGKTVSFRFRVTCSKGTYVRTLAVMIGERLGYPAHMSDLIRTASGPFRLEDCVTFEDVERRAADGTADALLIPIERALFHLPKYEINDKVAEKVKNGALLRLPAFLEKLDGPVVLVSPEREALALYVKHPAHPGLMKPLKVFR
ncbi:MULTISPECIES: tRNA pseudouridine(55) synthase TruB [Geobacillus]|uniref:tRNA pseudouridine synthase B n=1 Tax=Geobacillus proteiniphilus TaxID=860353 RepID=A0A1Q5T3S8_9BACL|nr:MULTISPECIES: tRNA pseudouridine(55) synthase TruB [Geobacillus]KDE49573.1 tRNA pseudouridine synthase B [Geobacillus sp. CAMR5420]OKO94882.1 tRNA pseudouridine synthase B [Geobacillus proteiniphilus]OPX03763.1 tRNA pseudouridine(55) synthase [Geobacillus sp. LEMMY01]WMJ18127.1 tRNA pseudouridine(55) synthase TruB [Geobacillus proteiniphilus]